MTNFRYKPSPPIHSEQLDAAAQITAKDFEEAQRFWNYWGTPLLNAMLNAESKPGERSKG